MFKLHHYSSVLHLLRYVLQQFFWCIAVTTQLISVMGVGIKWVVMTARCVTFALLDIPFFLPYIIWYLTTPTIIRRVAYRSSQKTKVRNLEKILTDQHMFMHTSASFSLTAIPPYSAMNDKDHEQGTAGTAAEPAVVTHHSSLHSLSAKKNSTSHAKTVQSWVQSTGSHSSSPINSSTQPAAQQGLASLTAKEAADTADMICTINPADGTYANGIPVPVHMVGHDDSDGNVLHDHSIDEALLVLQKRYRCSSRAQADRQKQHATSDSHSSVSTNASPSHTAATASRTEKEGGGSDVQPPAAAAADAEAEAAVTLLSSVPQPTAQNNASATNTNSAPHTPPRVNDAPAAPIEDTVKVSGAISEGATTDDDDEEDEEDRLNLHNRATLDIVLPVPLDTLFRFMQQDKFPFTLQRTRLRRRKFPIVILISGGAWIIGCYLWNIFLARVLAAKGYLVFCPDYRNFPQTTMEGMVLDVSDAIAWVLNNAERYNGDLDDVTVLGQSAGAHLTMMSILSQAQLAAHRFNTDTRQATPFHAAAPSPVAYNVPRYNPHKSIRCYIGLSGIYNVRNMVRHFDRRGLYRNVLYQIAGHRKDLPRYTVSYYFDEYHKHETGEELPDNFFDFMPRCMYFLHGDKDKSSPPTESANLVYLLRSAQRDGLLRRYEASDGTGVSVRPSINAEFILIPGATHTDAIVEEPLYGHNSHVVEFMSLYKCINTDAGTTNSQAGSASVNSSSSARERRIASGVQEHKINQELDGTSPVVPVNQPDNIFIAPIPHSSRPKLMRLASWICPF